MAGPIPDWAFFKWLWSVGVKCVSFTKGGLQLFKGGRIAAQFFAANPDFGKEGFTSIAELLKELARLRKENVKLETDKAECQRLAVSLREKIGDLEAKLEPPPRIPELQEKLLVIAASKDVKTSIPQHLAMTIRFQQLNSSSIFVNSSLADRFG